MAVNLYFIDTQEKQEVIAPVVNLYFIDTQEKQEEVVAPVVEAPKVAAVKDDYIQDWSSEMAPTPAAVPDVSLDKIPDTRRVR